MNQITVVPEGQPWINFRTGQTYPVREAIGNPAAYVAERITKLLELLAARDIKFSATYADPNAPTSGDVVVKFQGDIRFNVQAMLVQITGGRSDYEAG